VKTGTGKGELSVGGLHPSRRRAKRAASQDEVLTEDRNPLAAQNPGLPTPVGSFNITQLGLSADKIGKDTNFRGLSIFDKVIYTTKGSGGNGINTVYFIDTTGFDSNGKPLACPNGVGVPGATASLPTTPIFYDASQLQTKGVVPYNMCVLAGFPTNLAKKNDVVPVRSLARRREDALCHRRRRRHQQL
jgi:hypothetical protein